MNSITRTLATTLVISLSSVSASQARTISSISPPIGAGLGEQFCPEIQTIINTPFPNNNNSFVASPNQILNFPGLSCTPKTFEVIAPIDTTLIVEPSGGTTEYYFTETVVNNTGETWVDFHFELGFGIGDNFRRFDAAPLPLNLAFPEFDPPERDPLPTSSQFTSLVQEDISLWWSGGSVEPGATVDFTFSLDVPDDFVGSNIYSNFTIRQAPTISSVSEPSSIFAFLILSLMGIGSTFLPRPNWQDEG